MDNTKLKNEVERVGKFETDRHYIRRMKRRQIKAERKRNENKHTSRFGDGMNNKQRVKYQRERRKTYEY